MCRFKLTFSYRRICIFGCQNGVFHFLDEAVQTVDLSLHVIIPHHHIRIRDKLDLFPIVYNIQ